MNPKTLNSWCAYSDFCDALPHRIPRRQLLRLSDVGRFPAYVKPAGLKSEPLLKRTYGHLLPEYISHVECSGVVGTNAAIFQKAQTFKA
jgi:hypothetical protein